MVTLTQLISSQSSRIALAVILLARNFVEAKLFTSPDQLHTGKTYDYIVIGSGPGGSVVANRLSEDPLMNVLLVEAGPSDHNVVEIECPFLAHEVEPNALWDWNYTTTPQEGLDGRVVTYPRGRVLGGSTSINLLVWTRSSKDDFDKYATISGDNGWSWDALQPYFKKVERFVPPVDHHNTTGQFDPTIHGFGGLVNVTLPNAAYPSDPHVIATTQELQEYPFNLDMSSGDPLGIGWFQGTTGNGMRSSASSSYIDPFLSRKNLDVLVDTTVTKLVKTGSEDGLLAIRGVQIAQTNTSQTYSLKAKKEVILSGGSINSPQLLMLSGIGPASYLSSLGIPSLFDLPAVGQHLSDHPYTINQFGVANPSDDVNDNINRNTTLFNMIFAEWESNRTGIMANAGSNQVGWLRIPKDDPVWENAKDPSAGPLSPHYEFLFANGFASSIGDSAPETEYFMSIITVLVAPSSRGNVTLSSTDPFSPPVINPAFLSTSFDVAAIRTAIRSSAKFLSAPTWSVYITGQAGPFAQVNLTDDASVDAWARSQASTLWHPVGTARMGPCSDRKESAVNPDLTVKGTRGLRVVDASVFPFVPAAHPQAAVYAFAERAADLIKQGSLYC